MTHQKLHNVISVYFFLARVIKEDENNKIIASNWQCILKTTIDRSEKSHVTIALQQFRCNKPVVG